MAKCSVFSDNLATHAEDQNTESSECLWPRGHLVMCGPVILVGGCEATVCLFDSDKADVVARFDEH